MFFPGLVGYDSLCPLTSITVVSLSIAYNRLSCFSLCFGFWCVLWCCQYSR